MPDPQATARRRQAAAEALAIVRIAGGEPTPKAEALNERWIAGELTSEEVIEELTRPYRSRTSGRLGRGTDEATEHDQGWPHL